ncbi:hypothetical protein FNF31_03823 [Cafeteria roenbergensis]|uniref:Uncharacterized protein n=1 Tax=Cafeteria roenbergensis TaxID=33653 RepID=A0A5A8D9X4_CAFRO|nr:hypothetical protein FNF31_03823 [Cafeteria roenbergensis]
MREARAAVKFCRHGSGKAEASHSRVHTTAEPDKSASPAMMALKRLDMPKTTAARVEIALVPRAQHAKAKSVTGVTMEMAPAAMCAGNKDSMAAIRAAEYCTKRSATLGWMNG